MTAYTVDLSSALGVLSLSGPDAATFLQGQATCDARLVTADRGALGALCNLQGRMIVSFHVLAVADGLLLVMPRDRVEPMLQHLKKYAVFSKVTLHDASSACHLTGFYGSGADTLVAALVDQTPVTTYHVAANDTVRVLRLRGKHRFLALTASPLPLTHQRHEAGDLNHWTQTAMSAGEWLIDSANADKFLPQAFNYDLIDGVSFKKGCYTGQEVVARMHFKGKMKERLRHGWTDAEAPAVGTPIFRGDAGENQSPVGSVVAAVCTGERTHLALVIRHDAMAHGLRLGSVGGAQVDLADDTLSFPELAG